MPLIEETLRRTPKRRDPVKTRKRILNAAIVLFAEKGPLGASIDDISQASGLNRRMIYHYFGNKNGLYLEVLESVYGRLREIAIDAAAASGTLAELIDALMENYFAFLQKNPEFVSLLKWENAHDAEGLANIKLGDFHTRVLGPIRQALMRECENGNPISEEQVFFVLLSWISMCGYCFSNRPSLSAVFQQDLSNPEVMQRWLDYSKRFVCLGLGVEPLEHRGEEEARA